MIRAEEYPIPRASSWPASAELFTNQIRSSTKSLRRQVSSPLIANTNTNSGRVMRINHPMKVNRQPRRETGLEPALTAGREGGGVFIRRHVWAEGMIRQKGENYK